MRGAWVMYLLPIIALSAFSRKGVDTVGYDGFYVPKIIWII